MCLGRESSTALASLLEKRSRRDVRVWVPYSLLGELRKDEITSGDESPERALPPFFRDPVTQRVGQNWHRFVKGQALGAAYGPRPANSIAGIMSDPLQILVVEDEKAVAHMIAMVLGGPASKVATAANGWQALIKIGVTVRPFDVVITDHRMPRMTGLQLVRRLRAKNFGGKILVLSAHLSEEDIRAYEELSVDMMMTKPFDFDELQQAMAVLNKKGSVLAEA
jgi:CheY-like chemotaxis protein